MSVKVRYIGWGILLDDQNNEYICDVDGHGSIQSCETGELFYILKRNEFGNPIEIDEL